MYKKSLALVLGLSMVMAAFTGCQTKSTGTFPTEKTVELIAPASPGGGWDATARALQKVIKENDLAPGINVVVTNKPGGSGAVAWASLINKKNSHQVALDSSYIYTNELTGTEGAQKTSDLKPVATLTNEWIAIYVKADSKFQTINDVFDQLKKDPSSLKIAVAPGKGNDDHLSFMTAADSQGVDIKELDKNIMATTTGELLTGLIGGFYDVVPVGAQEGVEFLKNGDIRALAVTADTRMGGVFAEVPTLKESGIDVVFPHWRGLLAHPGMTDEEVAWWDDLIERAIATDDWKEVLANNNWLSYYRNSADTQKMWDEEFKSYDDITGKVGLKK